MPYIDNRILFYNPSLGLYDVYAFRGGILTRLQQKPITPGFTLVKSDGPSALFYDRSSGRAVAEAVDEDGSLREIRDVTIAPGWTHIAGDYPNHLYYNADTGAGAVTNDESGGTYPGVLSKGWTHILENGQTLFFYNANNGGGAFDYFNETRASGCTPLICPPTGVGLSEYRGFAAGAFALGWTSVVYLDAGKALLFYRKSDGWSVVGDIVRDGIADRAGTAKHLTPGWDAIVPIGGKLLFYDGFGGNYTLGRVDPDGYHEEESHPGGLWGGFTHVVPCAYVSGP